MPLDLELKVHMHTIVNINLDMTQSVFSAVSVLQDATQSGTQCLHEYHSQYQSRYNSVCILRYLSYKIKLNQEIKVYRHNIVNINPDMTQSVFSGIYLTTQFNSESISLFTMNVQCNLSRCVQVTIGFASIYYKGGGEGSVEKQGYLSLIFNIFSTTPHPLLFCFHSAISSENRECMNVLLSNFPESEFNVSQIRKKTRFQLSDCLNHETLDTILSGTKHI